MFLKVSNHRSCFLLTVVLVALLAIDRNAHGQEVDLLTGRLKMSINIGALQANDISIPISVYHHGGSPRVAEGEGKCGVGWYLSAGGGIQREIRGLPDEINTTKRKGWLYNTGVNAQAVQSFTPSADQSLSTNDDYNDYVALDSLHSNYKKDTEPDIFTVSAPGLSFQFVFDASGTLRPLTNTDVVVEMTANLVSFTVKTNNGLVYTFGGVDPSSRDVVLYKANVDTTATINTAANYIPVDFLYSHVSGAYFWKLVSITSTVTGTSATFKYNNSPGDWADGASKEYFDIDSLNYVISMYKFHDLKYIKLKSYKASFTWDRQLLLGVTIADTVSTDSKNVLFKYFSASTGTGRNKVFKKFLKELVIKGSACENGEAHMFDYMGVNPASDYADISSTTDWKRNWKQDYFGFPNSISSNKNKPRLYLLKAQTDSKRLRTIAIPGTSPIVISGDDRSVNYMLTGALWKITYPSGGFTIVGYGMNTYLDTSLWPAAEYNGPGARVIRLTSYAGELAYARTMGDIHQNRKIDKIYEYTQAGDGLSSGRITSPAKLGYIDRNSVRRVVNNLGDEPAVLYSRVVERIPGKGYTVHEFNNPGMFPQTSTALWKASHSRVARNLASQADRDTSAVWLKHGYYIFPYAPSTNYDFKRGSPTRVATYSENNTLLFEKTFTYTEISSSPQTIKGLRFEKLGYPSIGYVYYYGIYEILTGRSEFLTQEVVKQASLEDSTKLLESTTTYGYNGYNLLAAVTSILPNSTSTTRTIKYARDFQFTNPTASDTMAVALEALNTSNRGNMVVEEYTTMSMPEESPVTVSANLVCYRDFGSGVVLPYCQKSLLPGSSFTAAVMSGQSFVPSNNYRWTMKTLSYEEGKVQVAMGQSRILGATHFAKSNGMAVASITNAAANECVYDGFEDQYTFGLLRSDASLTTAGPGRTGEKAIVFTSNTQTLTSATPLVKNGTTYRVSCWAYAPSGRNVTFTLKNSGGTPLQGVTTPVPITDQWVYLESVITIGGSDVPHTLEVKTDATTNSQIRLDDIILIPTKARIALQTGLALKGVTSATDDRGFSGKVTYDHMGRPVSTLDRNRNLVAKNEYATRNSAPPRVRAAYNMNPYQPHTGGPTIFTPNLEGLLNCDTNITYVWEVDGVAQTAASDGTLTFTFQAPGLHNVKFTASAPTGTYSFGRSFCINHDQAGVTINHSITNSQGQPANLTIDCLSDNRIISLVLPAVPPGCIYDIFWTKDGVLYGYGSSITVHPTSVSSTTDYEYIATVSLNCGSIKECALTDIEAFNGQKSFTVTNVYSAQCP